MSDSARVKKRYDEILAAGFVLAAGVGLDGLRRDAVAAQAGRSFASVNNAFGTLDNLKDKVVDLAIQLAADPGDTRHDKALKVLAKALANGHAGARAAPIELRERAVSILS